MYSLVWQPTSMILVCPSAGTSGLAVEKGLTLLSMVSATSLRGLQQQDKLREGPPRGRRCNDMQVLI